MATFGFSSRKARIDIVDLIYPVGSIYMSVNSANPSTLFGGTWVAWGTGRVPVGIDTSQTEFNTVEKTGGAKTHTLTVAQMPSHTHVQNSHRHSGTGVVGVNTDTLKVGSGSNTPVVVGASPKTGNYNTDYTTATNQSTGGGRAHNNLQPYITCYMWKRTA